jgi:FKBP-type peptidyl-prolyl cis-trans isomerase SlyD
MLTFTSLVLVLTACASGSDDGANDAPVLVIEDGDIVDVHYVLTLDDGSTIDSSRERGTPFAFTVGKGDVFVGFDRAVKGKQVGDVNTVRIEAVDGYGVWDPTRVVEVEIAPSQADVKVGDEVFVPQRGIIVEIVGGVAKVDINHELAGEALTFQIEVLAVTRG